MIMVRQDYNFRRLRSQRGGAAILFVLLLPVLLGFAALAVDLARLHLARVELHNAADAAALAGAHALAEPPNSSTSSSQPFPLPLFPFASGFLPSVTSDEEQESSYNWDAAESAALEVARHNIANGEQIVDASVETGYWNLDNPALGFRPKDTSGLPIAGDIPAVRVIIALSENQNNGPLPFFFAPILNITDSDVSASATAVLPAASGGTGLFPFVLSKQILDHYWDSSTGTPILQNGEAPSIRLGTIYDIGGDDVLSGQWTTFESDVKNPSANFMTTLIDEGNDTLLSIGDDTYIQPGAKATLYAEVPVGTDVALFVVDDVDPDSYQPIVAIAAFHIDGYSQGGKYIEGHFIDLAMFGGLEPGSGSGVDYGAYTPPVIVQ